MAEFTGHCARCHATITATLTFGPDSSVKPPPVIGSYHQCGERPQAVPLTLREAV